jgi:hypothetical protein
VSIAWVFWPRKRARTVSGAAMASASSWRCAAVAASTAARRAVQFDHQLSCVGQVPGQAGAVVAGALHRPRAQPGAPHGETALN